MHIQQNANNRFKAPLLQGDFWVGAFLLLVGFWACWEASGFDARSRTYPMILAAMLAVAGLALALGATVRAPSPSSSFAPLQVMLPAAFVIGLWAFALRLGLGFGLPTFLMQAALLRMAGIQRWSRVFLYALLITAVAYLLFAQVLGIRFPNSSLSHILQGL